MSLPLNLASEASSQDQAWSPVVSCASSALVFTQTTASGDYVRQGGMVIVNFSVAITVTAYSSFSDAQLIVVENLPYSPSKGGPGAIFQIGGVALPSGSAGISCTVDPSAGGVTTLFPGAAPLDSTMTPPGTVVLAGSTVYFTTDPA